MSPQCRLSCSFWRFECECCSFELLERQPNTAQDHGSETNDSKPQPSYNRRSFDAKEVPRNPKEVSRNPDDGNGKCDGQVATSGNAESGQGVDGQEKSGHSL